MPQPDSQPDLRSPVRRRTVRIVQPPTISRAAMVSVVVAIVAALLFPVVWHFRQKTEQVVRPPPRDITQVEMDWKCDVGHTFSAAGQFGSRLCWTCDRAAYPVTHYTCPNPNHGPYEVAVLFEADGNGSPKKSRLRLIGRDWVSAREGVRCPRCDRRLVYKRDSLERLRRGEKSSGT